MGFQLLAFTIGLLLLYNGATWLVKGAISLAEKIGLSPTIIGLTVVAFGTSAPELIVSIISSCQNKSMMTIGNVVGSNICNLTMILGIIALIRPVTASRTVITQDIPIMLSASICLFVLSLDSEISTLDGLILFLGAIVYICFNYTRSKNEEINPGIANNNSTILRKEKKKTYPIKTQISIILLGIISLTIGAELLVNAAIKIMVTLEISEKCIGLTIVAVGTSVPELATSLVAIMKKQTNLSIGNLVGSNLFNILNVIGITALVRPITITAGFIKSELITDYAVMIFTSSLPLLLMSKNLQSITKIKGLLLITLHIGYTLILFYRT